LVVADVIVSVTVCQTKQYVTLYDTMCDITWIGISFAFFIYVS